MWREFCITMACSSLSTHEVLVNPWSPRQPMKASSASQTFIRLCLLKTIARLYFYGWFRHRLRQNVTLLHRSAVRLDSVYPCTRGKAVFWRRWMPIYVLVRGFQELASECRVPSRPYFLPKLYVNLPMEIAEYLVQIRVPFLFMMVYSGAFSAAWASLG